MTTPSPQLRLPALPTLRNAPPRGVLGRWIARGQRLDEHEGRHATHPWYLVMWLSGVDYFSTLGYQPGIALLAAGALSPIATAVLVVVTLLGALPVYAQVASRSHAGQGSIAMLEGLLSGWTAKLAVLILLGFAGTDFVITITLSAADASQHAIENPLLHPWLGDAHIALTCALLVLLALVFLRGFVEAIGLAAAVGIPYVALNLVVLCRGVYEIAQHPSAIDNWGAALSARGDPAALALAVAIVFPKLALGLSGFETGVSVMPLISGGSRDSPGLHGRHEGPPAGRIRAARKLLACSALIMSALLLLSSFVTALLIPRELCEAGGPASGRALAYLAHQFFGPGFGTVYDICTIAILWFAGASALAGLLHLIPRYLPRFGMAPQWAIYQRPMIIVLLAVCLLITWIFRADVESQGGAYATGVLVLILSGAIAVALSLGREWRNGRAKPAGLGLTCYFWIVSVVFAYTLVDNVVERPDGVIIGLCFILGILTVSAISRYRRATELRVTEATFADEASARLWGSLTGKRVNLVPLRVAGERERARKAAEIKAHYAIHGPIAFVHVRLMDNRSEFLSPLQVRVVREGDDFAIEVTGAVAIANTIAYVSELLDPISLFLGLTRQNLMTQAVRYILWGEGETGFMVYAILIRYWRWTAEDDVRPLIFLMSE